MGFDIIDAAKKKLEGLVNASTPNPRDKKSPTKPDITSLGMDQVYEVLPDNWYSAKPYGFIFKSRDGKVFVMFLPINPTNLTINTSFATNVIPTLYGTVEEHSEVRYYDIVIEGTTGMAPKHVAPTIGNTSATEALKRVTSSGRASFPISQGIGGIAGGFFAKTLETVNQAANKALDLLKGDKKPFKAFNHEDSGYVAFHNLYRFLMRYKADAAGISSQVVRGAHPLQFFNYKDNNIYDVAVRNFSLRRSADNPMLYNYSIQLRGYNLRGTSGSKQLQGVLQDRINNLGLNGVKNSSLLGNIKKYASGAKSVLSGALGGLDILGR